MGSNIAAGIFGVLILITVVFQLALATGAPWGSLAMGGRYPGRFPTAIRIAAIVQAGVLALLGMIVWIHTGLVTWGQDLLPPKAIWVVVFVSVITLVLNTITPSKWERRIWAPVTLLMTICSLIVALS